MALYLLPESVAFIYQPLGVTETSLKIKLLRVNWLIHKSQRQKQNI